MALVIDQDNDKITPSTSGLLLLNEKLATTELGGRAVKITNKSGGTVTKGQVVKVDTTTDDAFNLSGTTEYQPIGVVYDATIADNAEGWIVQNGTADVAMEDNTAATHGYWVKTSDTEAGYADSTNAAPPGGGVSQLDEHSREVGHCFESVAAGGGGTHILARCTLHFS